MSTPGGSKTTQYKSSSIKPRFDIKTMGLRLARKEHNEVAFNGSKKRKLHHFAHLICRLASCLQACAKGKSLLKGLGFRVKWTNHPALSTILFKCKKNNLNSTFSATVQFKLTTSHHRIMETLERPVS